MKQDGIFILLMLVILGLTVLSAPGFAETSYFDVDREFYPYYPSLVKWNKSGAAPQLQAKARKGIA